MVRSRSAVLLTRTESYLYDLSDNLLRRTDRKGQVTGYTLDALDRVTQVGFGATVGNPTAYTSTIGVTLDAADRATTIVDSIAGTITRQYDNRFDAWTREVTPEGTVNVVYDAAGRRTQMQVTGQSAVTWGYDDANRPTTITQGANVVSYAYDAASRRTSVSIPNGITTLYSWDDATQLTGLTHQRGGSTIGGVNYT
jgi:YD repeat-containing protein